MIRALVFDFDGLIIDTESALIEAYADVHARHGVPFDRGVFLRNVGHADYAFDPWRAFDRSADRAALEDERGRRNRERGLALQPLPGVVELIASAERSGLPLAVASNSGHDHVDGHLRRLGLFSRFHCVACREDVKAPKPEPDLYRHAVGRLGVSPHEAVALEDSQTGLLAAHRAGLRTIAVPGASTAHHDFSKADLKVNSLAEVQLATLEKRLRK